MCVWKGERGDGESKGEKHMKRERDIGINRERDRMRGIKRD